MHKIISTPIMYKHYTSSQIYKAKKASTAPTITPAGLRPGFMEEAAPVNSGGAVPLPAVPVPEAKGKVAVVNPDGIG